MSTTIQDVACQSLLSDAFACIVEHAERRQVVSVDLEVSRLLKAHPNAHMTPEELKETLMDFAAGVQAAIEVGARPEDYPSLRTS